jgi:pimeloyl-ACP methyl ester carboxylesterase
VAARIPGSRLEVIPRASHLCFVERPEIYLPIANEFMAAAEAVLRGLSPFIRGRAASGRG